MKVELKDLQTCSTRRGYAFSGEIWINGDKAGDFSNSGTGEGDDFHFESGLFRDKFRQAVREWGGYYEEMIEPEDQFISFLMGERNG